jgi:hypothetical protein
MRQGFSAGEADFLEAQTAESRDQPLEDLDGNRKKHLMREALGPTVPALEVAPVGDHEGQHFGRFKARFSYAAKEVLSC